MATQDHFRKLTRAYLSARTNEYYRPELTISDGGAVISIDIDPKMHHAAGAVHGSVYFKLLDDAAFFAANSRVEDVFVLTASFNIYMLRPIVTGRLISTGTLVEQTRRLLVAEAVLRDGDGRDVARGSGTFMRSEIVLGPEIGYR